jgi:hypothetical protein
MSGNEGWDMHPANLVYDTTWIAKLTRRHEYLQPVSVDSRGWRLSHP